MLYFSYGKVRLRKPSILVWCPDSLEQICGKGLKVEAPCGESATDLCIWKNFTYQPVSTNLVNRYFCI